MPCTCRAHAVPMPCPRLSRHVEPLLLARLAHPRLLRQPLLLAQSKLAAAPKSVPRRTAGAGAGTARVTIPPSVVRRQYRWLTNCGDGGRLASAATLREDGR